MFLSISYCYITRRNYGPN